MRHYLLLALLVLLALVLESTTFTYFTVLGVQPDLLLLLAIYYALFFGSRKGALFGFICGLAQDLLVGQFIGLNATTKTLTVYIVGLLETKIYKEYALIPLLIVFIASLCNEVVFYVLSALFNRDLSPVVAIKNLIIPGAVFNTVIAMITYGPFAKSVTKGALAPDRY